MHVRVFPLPSSDPDPDLLAIFIEKSFQTVHSFKTSDAPDHEVVMLKTRVCSTTRGIRWGGGGCERK